MSILVDEYGKPLKYKRRYRNSLENPQTSLSDPDAWLVDAWGGGETDAGVNVNRKTAIGYPPLWRGINLISGDVATMPLVVYERGLEEERKKATSHPAHNLLLFEPNEFMTAFDFKRTLQYHAMLFGNGYAAIFRSLRTPVELLVLSPTETFPVQANGRLWYVTKVGEEQRRIPAEDVLHIRGLSFDGLIGHSVLEVMREALGLGMAAREFGARFFGEGSNQSGVLMVPGKFKQEQIRNAIQSWEEMAKGLKRSHKVALLQDGVKWQPTTISPEQGQFNETRQFEVREVANILGIPPHKLGDSSRTSYNSLEQENLSYLHEALKPWLSAWQSECRKKLLSKEEKKNDTHFFEFLHESLLAVNIEAKVKTLETEVNAGMLSLDEARAKLNMPPLPDGLGKRFRMPANMVFIDAPQETEEPGVTVSGEGAEGDILSNVEAQQDVQLNGSQIQSMILIGDKVAVGDWPGEAAKPAMEIAFPLVETGLFEKFVDELEKFEPPERPAQTGGVPGATPLVEPIPAQPEEDEPTDALAKAHRTIIANDIQRMVRRLSNEAKQSANKPERLAAWLQTFESEHGPTVVEVVRDGIVAHCVATCRPESAEPLTAWACTQLFSAYREDLGVTLSSTGELPVMIEALADRFERDLAMQIAETITTGVTT